MGEVVVFFKREREHKPEEKSFPEHMAITSPIKAIKTNQALITCYHRSLLTVMRRSKQVCLPRLATLSLTSNFRFWRTRHFPLTGVERVQLRAASLCRPPDAARSLSGRRGERSSEGWQRCFRAGSRRGLTEGRNASVGFSLMRP